VTAGVELPPADAARREATADVGRRRPLNWADAAGFTLLCVAAERGRSWGGRVGGLAASTIARLVGYSPACGRAEMGGAEPGRFTLVMDVDGPRFRPRKSGTPATSQSEPSVSSSSARLVSTGSADDGAGCAAS